MLNPLNNSGIGDNALTPKKLKFIEETVTAR